MAKVKFQRGKAANLPAEEDGNVEEPKQEEKVEAVEE